MSAGSDRWICAACHANNMPHVPQCFRCHAPRPATVWTPPLPPQPQYQPAYTPPPRPRAGVPWWSWLITIMGGCALLSVLTCMGLAGVSHSAGQAVMDSLKKSDGISSADVFRIHQSDISGTDPATGKRIIRCHLCNGTGYAPHFQHTGDGRDPSNYSVDGQVVCPNCNGTRVMLETKISPTVQVVPDSEPTSYQ